MDILLTTFVADTTVPKSRKSYLLVLSTVAYFNRIALMATRIEEPDINKAPKAGCSKIPKAGYNNPAVSGMADAL